MLSSTVEALNDVLQRGLLKLASQLADFTANLMHYTTDCSKADALLAKGKPSLLLSASCPTDRHGGKGSRPAFRKPARMFESKYSSSKGRLRNQEVRL